MGKVQLPEAGIEPGSPIPQSTVYPSELSCLLQVKGNRNLLEPLLRKKISEFRSLLALDCRCICICTSIIGRQGGGNSTSCLKQELNQGVPHHRQHPNTMSYPVSCKNKVQKSIHLQKYTNIFIQKQIGFFFFQVRFCCLLQRFISSSIVSR